MDQYCIVVCGLRAGASDEVSTWAPVAAALRMEHDEFSRRVVAALPRIVRQQLDRASAERIAQLLQGLHVDARALPGDEQLVYIDRDGSSRGPLPRSALDAFIAPGESYRLHGSLAWQTWPEPLEYESSPPPAQAFDEVMAAPVGEAFAAAPAEPPDDEPPAAVASSSSLPPPLPIASSPAAVVAIPDDEPASDDALTDPPSDEPLGEADVAAPPAEAATRLPRRSPPGRVWLLLALVGVAAWAYLHWGADTHVDDSPPPAPVGHAQPANGSTTAAAAATSVAMAPAMAASTAAASARSTPAPATSVPASGGTTALPATAATMAAPSAASSTAPAASSGMTPAHAANATARPAPPAAAGSSPRS